MENVLTSKTFIVNVGPGEFNKSIDLSKTSTEVKNIRELDGIRGSGQHSYGMSHEVISIQ